jgi:hypothetical protein
MDGAGTGRAASDETVMGGAGRGVAHACRMERRKEKEHVREAGKQTVETRKEYVHQTLST